MSPVSRRRFLFLAGAAPLAALSGCSNAGSPRGKGDVPTLGFLQITSNSVLDAAREGYFKALREEGFEDGKTIRIITKDAQGDLPTAQLIAKEFQDQGVDLIGTASTPALQAAVGSVKEIPIVFTAVSDPYKAGAGESPTNHRPNVTGANNYLPADDAMRLAKELIPGLKKAGTLYDPGEVFTETYLEMIRKAAKEVGVELVEIATPASSDIIPGAQALQARGAEAVVQVPSNVIYTGIDGLIRETEKLGIPLISADPSHVNTGAVAAIGLDVPQWGYISGKIAARVLKGESPAKIPFAPITDKKLAVNEAAAAKYGIEIPPSVLKRVREQKQE